MKEYSNAPVDSKAEMWTKNRNDGNLRHNKYVELTGNALQSFVKEVMKVNIPSV